MDQEKKLSPKQAEILEFIDTYSAQMQHPPTYREIARHFGYTAVGTVQDHVKALVRKGYIEKPSSPSSRKSVASAASPQKSLRRPARALHTTTRAESVSVPILGQVPAGSPMEAIEDVLGAVPFRGRSRAELFALKVKGESMRDAGILDGDFVIIRKQSEARNGEIVVAQIDGEATVKRLDVRKDGRVLLLPENPKFSPIEVPVHALGELIQGVVVGLQRYY